MAKNACFRSFLLHEAATEIMACISKRVDGCTDPLLLGNPHNLEFLIHTDSKAVFFVCFFCSGFFEALASISHFTRLKVGICLFLIPLCAFHCPHQKQQCLLSSFSTNVCLISSILLLLAHM